MTWPPSIPKPEAVREYEDSTAVIRAQYKGMATDPPPQHLMAKADAALAAYEKVIERQEGMLRLAASDLEQADYLAADNMTGTEWLADLARRYAEQKEK